MAGDAGHKYPPEAYRVRGEVFACLHDRELRINLLSELGISGEAYRDVPTELAPIHLRLPRFRAGY